MTTREPPTIFHPGDRVIFAGVPVTLVEAMFMEDYDNPSKWVPWLCGSDDHEPEQLWVIRFDNGAVKKYACQHSMTMTT